MFQSLVVYTLADWMIRRCTCSDSGLEHPGPAAGGEYQGRGAPRVDIIGYQGDVGEAGVTAQSIRIAPFSADRVAGVGAEVVSAANSIQNPFTGNTQ